MSTIEYTEEDLAYNAETVRTPEANPEDLATNIARKHWITVDELKGHDRHAHIVRARKELYAALRGLGWSHPAVARFVGNRDHTTVLYGCKGRTLTPEQRQEIKFKWATKPESVQ